MTREKTTSPLLGLANRLGVPLKGRDAVLSQLVDQTAGLNRAVERLANEVLNLQLHLSTILAQLPHVPGVPQELRDYCASALRGTAGAYDARDGLPWERCLGTGVGALSGRRCQLGKDHDGACKF